MMEQLIQWDKDIFLWLNGCNTPFFDGFMWYVSKSLPWLPLYILLLYLCIRFYGRQTLYVILFTVLLVTITDQVSVHAFKNVFCRLRPTHNPEISDLVHVVNGYRGGQFGFVSSHAANYFGIAVFFIMLFGRRYRFFVIPALLCAALIAYSRIYLGVHYPADVVGGAILGAVAGYALGRLFLFLAAKVLPPPFVKKHPANGGD